MGRLVLYSMLLLVASITAFVAYDVKLANENLDLNSSYTAQLRDYIRDFSSGFTNLSNRKEKNSSVVGRWTGPMKNSIGGLVRSSKLIIEKELDGNIQGRWHSGWAMQDAKRVGNTLTWKHLKVEKGCKNYTVKMLIGKAGDDATLSYKAFDSCRQGLTYTGKAALLKEDSKKRLPRLTGRWTGSLVNTRGDEPGSSTLVVSNDRINGFSGKWHGGWKVEDGVRDETTASWKHTGVADGCRDYLVNMILEEDNPDRAVLSFKATDRCREPREYTGLSELRRQGDR